jgi:hypothetical protein
MARQETDREDLLREATALVERMELLVDGCGEPVVAGFRRDGAASFYFGAEVVCQFNSAGQLRRAYLNGLLYKAELGRLASLRRERGPTEVVLARVDLSAAETAAIVSQLRLRLQTLQAALASGSYRVVGQVPADADIVSRIVEWLAARGQQIEIASRPNAK